MKKNKDNVDIIDYLQENGIKYYVDYLPMQVKSDEWSDFEDYFRETFIDEFSKKIVRIVLKLMCYYETEIYLTELAKNYSGFLEKYSVYKNIRNLELAELVEIIEYVIKKDKSSVQLLLKSDDGYCNFGVCGDFQIGIYSSSTGIIELISLLVKQENLFILKSISN